jgi:hypothetical protein
MPDLAMTVDVQPRGRGRHARVIAGTIELFLGAYFMTFGSLAVLYFARQGLQTAAMIGAAGALCGVLLVFRAERLLGWRRWLFWLVIVPMIVVPIAWYLPALLSAIPPGTP